MSDLFQEHKRFIVTYVGGALLFLVLWLVINAIFSSDIRRLKLGIQSARQQQSLAVKPGDLRKVKDDTERAEAAHAALAKTISRVPDRIDGVGELALTEKQTAHDLYYNTVKERIRSDEVEKCAIRNIDVDPDLGLPDAFPANRREVDWYLRGLDVVRQLLQMVLKVDSDAIYEGGIARLDRIDIATVPKTRIAPGAKLPYLVEHKVNVTMVGTPKAIFAVLENCARRREDGRFLKIASSTLRSLDLPPGDAGKIARGMDPEDLRRVEAKFELVGVDVHLDGEIKTQGK